MIGTAPAAKIYAMKVLSSMGGGAPESRVIAAMDRAITLKRNFNDGLPGRVFGFGTEDDPFRFESLDVQVVNMSLGGPTLFAGRDIQDQLTLAMLDVGITLVTAAGNSGFAAMTGGSPGTGRGSVTVGASSTSPHERVLRDLQGGVGNGLRSRPFDPIQTAYFSSRGPTADGRLDPDLSANGFATYVNVFAAVTGTGVPTSCGAANAVPGSCISRIMFVSGTSLSAPTVAGAAAVLRQALPSASALQTRNALVLGANRVLVGDGSGRIDQGAGFLDIRAAGMLLATGAVKNEMPSLDSRDDNDDEPDDVGAGGKSVTRNVRKLGFRTVQFVNDRFKGSVESLKPGQVSQFFVPSDNRTSRLVVTISDIVREGPTNELFGDDLFVMGVDAPTSFAVHRIGNGGEFVSEDRAFTIDNPQTGLVRIAVQGDWTNASPISAKITIERRRQPLGRPSVTAPIGQDDLIPYEVDVPEGPSDVLFELFWRQNWGRYPTNDLDMFVLTPYGDLLVDANGNRQGATLDSPERVVVTNPVPGRWTIIVSGFAIQPGSAKNGKQNDSDSTPGWDSFTLRVTADGQPLKIIK
jgi:hypothetical protein